MKKSFLKLGLLTAGLTALVIPTALSITSCSTSAPSTNKLPDINVNSNRYSLKQNVTWSTKKEEKTTFIKLGNDSQTIGTQTSEALVLDPNLNKKAIENIKTTFKNKLDKEKLQQDFNSVLTRFFKAYEFESEKKENLDETIEIEADIEKIIVKEIFQTLNDAKENSIVKEKELAEKLTENSGFMYALVDVTYEVENNTRDGSSREETQPKLFIINPTFSTESQILSTIRNLHDMIKKDGGNSGPHTVDVKHLFDLYYGELDENNKPNNEPDEQSIFHQFNSKVHDGIGGLIGYSLDLTNLAYTSKEGKIYDSANQLSKAVNINKFYAPSSSIFELHLPAETIKPSDNSVKLDFSLNLDALSQKTLDQWETELVKNTTEYSVFTNLLKDTSTQGWLKDKISSIHINSLKLNGSSTTQGSKDNLLLENAIEVIVQLKDENTLEVGMPKIISIVIQESWCSQDQQPVPSPQPGTQKTK